MVSTFNKHKEEFKYTREKEREMRKKRSIKRIYFMDKVNYCVQRTPQQQTFASHQQRHK